MEIAPEESDQVQMLGDGTGGEYAFFSTLILVLSARAEFGGKSGLTIRGY